MARFKVGDKVRVIDDKVSFVPKFNGRVGVVTEDERDHPTYYLLVEFDNGDEREFGDEELELVESAPTDEPSDVIASGVLTFASQLEIALPILIDGKRLDEILRQATSEGVEVEIVVRRKEAPSA